MKKKKAFKKKNMHLINYRKFSQKEKKKSYKKFSQKKKTTELQNCY